MLLQITRTSPAPLPHTVTHTQSLHYPVTHTQSLRFLLRHHLIPPFLLLPGPLRSCPSLASLLPFQWQTLSWPYVSDFQVLLDPAPPPPPAPYCLALTFSTIISWFFCEVSFSFYFVKFAAFEVSWNPTLDHLFHYYYCWQSHFSTWVILFCDFAICYYRILCLGSLISFSFVCCECFWDLCSR